MRRLLVVAFWVTGMVLVTSVTNAHAFTLLRDVWPTASITYAIDASFSNQGTAWINRATEAAQHWTNLTDFDFVFNAASPNQLRTGALSCSNPIILATMTPTEDVLGIYRSSFVITVNTGCPNIVWYTGTPVFL